METKKKQIAWLENAAIVIVILSALYSIAISTFHIEGLSAGLHSYLEVNRILQRMLGLMQLFVAWRLYKRMRMAWLITLGASAALLALHIISGHSLGGVAAFCELFVLAVLLLCQKDFGRRSDRISVNKAIGTAALCMTLVLADASLGFFTLRVHFAEPVTFLECFMDMIRAVTFSQSAAIFQMRELNFYMEFAVWFTWICLFGCLALLLKPLIYNPFTDLRDREKVLDLVRRYGQNPMSYLCIERDKRYFFGTAVEGAAAYGVAGGVVVCCGDPVCAEGDMPLFISEFVDFCRRNEYALVLLNVTDRFVKLYDSLGFASVKYGEDACFQLSEYQLAGGKAAKVRAAINHAGKAGITVSEYKPKEGRDPKVEGEIQEISEEWLSSKNGGEMGFMLGGNGLEEPLDRRYFTARSAEGQMLGYVVFLPYNGGKAYLADVTRRRNHAPQGVLEKITYEAFQVFRKEGALWGNLGLVPLANLGDEGDEKIATKLFQFVYENLNSVYGFKALHHAKEKYAPTSWQTRYVAYYPGIFTPPMAYAIVKVQNPGGLRKMVPSFKIRNKKK